MRYKIIHDAIHGSLKFENVALQLIESPEMQRLNGVKQLGLGYLIFPGANHTRLEHSLGVSYVAARMGSALKLPKEEIETLRVAGLLHDLGHAPFSHTLEFLLHGKTGKDHMEITADIIRGKIDLVSEDLPDGRERIHEILNEAGIPVDMVVKMILGETERRYDLLSMDRGQKYFGVEKNYMVNIISGSLDADQIDYLLRDSHYTGVAHGTIDFPRILNTLRIKNGELMLDKKGVPALEGMLVARALMYSAVYMHKTNRICELMLSRAVEDLHLDNWLKIYALNDAQLFSLIFESENAYAREIALRLKYRRLFKKVVVKRPEEIGENDLEELEKLKSLREKRKIEREIAESAGIDERYVLIDVPEGNIKLSEPRLSKTDVKILDDGKVVPFSKFSPLARALQIRKVKDWVLMIAAPKNYVEQVKKAAERILF